MRISVVMLLCLVAGALAMGAPVLPKPSPATVARTEYKGWNVFRLSNGIVTLLVAPDIGGRVIQIQLGDHEYLFNNPALAGKVLPESENGFKLGWANYGGDKVWPAPQGWSSDSEWPGPPDYVLEGSRFAADVVKETPDEVAVRVTSPKDLRCGIQFARTFHVYAGTTRVRVDQVMRNISKRRVRWGIWHNMQHDAADRNDPSKPNPELYAWVPLAPRSAYPQGYYNVFGDVRHPSYTLVEGGRMLRIHYLYQVGKVAADTDRGWFAVVNGQKQIGIVEEFKHVPGAEYPDGASVEFWNHGAGTVSLGATVSDVPADPAKTPYFFEAEALSPFAALEPGEEYEFTVQWCPARMPNPVREAGWAGAVSEPLAAKLAGGRATLEGTFGVFMPGRAEVVFFSAAGEELSREDLGVVNPREVFRLAKSVAAPAGAYRVSVQLRGAGGEILGTLDGAVLRAR